MYRRMEGHFESVFVGFAIVHDHNEASVVMATAAMLIQYGGVICSTVSATKVERCPAVPVD